MRSLKLICDLLVVFSWNFDSCLRASSLTKSSMEDCKQASTTLANLVLLFSNLVSLIIISILDKLHTTMSLSQNVVKIYSSFFRSFLRLRLILRFEMIQYFFYEFCKTSKLMRWCSRTLARAIWFVLQVHSLWLFKLIRYCYPFVYEGF